MKNPTILTLGLLCVSCLLAFAQMPSKEARISAGLAGIQDSHLSKREAAFHRLMQIISEEDSKAWEADRTDALTKFFARHPEQSDRIKLGLIRLLTAENKLFLFGVPGSRTEDDGDYYAEVIDTVSSLTDERAIPALVGTGGDAVKGLLKYGNKAIVPVLERLKSSDPTVRGAALSTGTELLRASSDPGAHERLKELLRSSLLDPFFPNRSVAVREVGCLEDREEFVPAIRQIAKTDPAKLPGKALDGGDGEEFYPVRSDARRVLRDIESHAKCKWRSN